MIAFVNIIIHFLLFEEVKAHYAIIRVVAVSYHYRIGIARFLKQAA
jgi:hypothetical protein